MNHRMRTVLTAALVVSILFNVAFAVAALTGVESTTVAPDPTGEQPVKQPKAALHESLDLAAEQQATFGQQRKQIAQQISQLRQQVLGNREQLWRMVAGDAPDRLGLEAQIAQISTAQQQVQALVIEHMLWMREQLSEEQQTKFDSFVETKMCSCPRCDGGCLGGCPAQGQCAKSNLARSEEHSGSECPCGR